MKVYKIIDSVQKLTEKTSDLALNASDKLHRAKQGWMRRRVRRLDNELEELRGQLEKVLPYE